MTTMLHEKVEAARNATAWVAAIVVTVGLVWSVRAAWQWQGSLDRMAEQTAAIRAENERMRREWLEAMAPVCTQFDRLKKGGIVMTPETDQTLADACARARGFMGAKGGAR